MSKKKTFWPYGILISIFAIILACIATIIFASNYPVYEDDFYLSSKYQDVKFDYAKIEQAQNKFNHLYDIKLDLNSSIAKKKRIIYHLENNASKVRFIIIPKQDTKTDLQANLLLTRPHTSEQDKELHATLSQNPMKQIVLDATLPKLEKGRWQLKLKLTSDEKFDDNVSAVGFFAYELNAQ